MKFYGIFHLGLQENISVVALSKFFLSTKTFQPISTLQLLGPTEAGALSVGVKTSVVSTLVFLVQLATWNSEINFVIVVYGYCTLHFTIIDGDVWSTIS